MKFWFIPTDRGDIRLERAANGCILEIDRPTTNEKKIVERFIAACQAHGWLEKIAIRLDSDRVQRVVLEQPVEDAGPLLVTSVLGDSEVWTAIRRVNGTIELSDGAHANKEGPPVDAAATVRPPQRGCPAPEPCNRRASEVLRTFSTQSQWREWERTGSMVAYGGGTGEAYRIYHRNMASELGLAHILVDSKGRERCVWDARVPAEEEVLATKLAIEHREWWVKEHPWV